MEASGKYPLRSASTGVAITASPNQLGILTIILLGFCFGHADILNLSIVNQKDTIGAGKMLILFLPNSRFQLNKITQKLYLNDKLAVSVGL